MNLLASQPMKNIAVAVNTLDSRQQRALLLLIVLLACLTCGSLLWNTHSTLKHSLLAYQETQQTLEWMRQQSSRIEAERNTPAFTADARSLISIATQAAKASGISVARYQPDNDGQLRLWLDAVDYTDMIQWSVTMRNVAGVSVDAMTVQNTATPGIVNVSMQLNKVSKRPDQFPHTF